MVLTMTYYGGTGNGSGNDGVVVMFAVVLLVMVDVAMIVQGVMVLGYSQWARSKRFYRLVGDQQLPLSFKQNIQEPGNIISLSSVVK